MGCNYPIKAYRIRYVWDNKVVGYSVVFDDRKGDVVAELSLPCGQCDGCRLERSRQWALRCMHEAKMHEQNCVITLTYNDEHMPYYQDLVYEDFQKFMKRLRKRYGGYLPSKRHQGPIRKIRFFMCGEYGEDKGRPHYHACIFGLDFDDKIYFKNTPAGSKLFISKELQSLWSDENRSPIGFATIGELNFDSAGYIARYVMKKDYGKTYEYDMVDVETGELYTREKEFTRMSLKPGIGTAFYNKYYEDMFPHDVCVLNGIEMKPPRYYMLKLKKSDPDLYEEIQYGRARKALEHSEDNTEERRLIKEKVLKQKVKLLKRELN